LDQESSVSSVLNRSAQIRLGSLIFEQRFGGDMLTSDSKFPMFVIAKSDTMLKEYEERLKSVPINDMLELGIMKGGSAAYFSQLLKPARQMAIDIHDTAKSSLSELEESVRNEGRDLHCRYDLSQANPQAIIEAYQAHFGRPAEFDLVIDDASHNYELSLASFNGLFGHVRPGGIYAIEDWGWGHWLAGGFQEPGNQEYGSPALSNLVLFCVMAAATGTSGIARVDVTPDTAFVYRDANPVPANLHIENSFLTRGREFSLV
jgi:SAM-dependent methyltransferase